jgi:ATP-dependent Lon protease
VKIPDDPLEQVIGQSRAVEIAKIAARQRRHLLLVAAPGTGKSMLAQAIAYHLPKPTTEVAVLHNPANPERPTVEVRSCADAEKERVIREEVKGRIVAPLDVPSFVAERLGFRCPRCGFLGKASDSACNNCGADKTYAISPFSSICVEQKKLPDRVHTTRLKEDNTEEVIVYERIGEKVRVLDQEALERLESLTRKRQRKVILPFDRNTFVVATGASETELLGDVKHDPYGGHDKLGTPPYSRVVPGAVHEAHEGVLFIDELSALASIQRYLLTAMQEKVYPIVGRNAQSTGASVKVEGVPCDFVLVAASNIRDLPLILPPLRSRIMGGGYEVLLDTVMPDTPNNRESFYQFVAQEITKDGRIPHASEEAVESLIKVAIEKAREYDRAENSLSLRFRELSGVIRLAGDYAASQGAELIESDSIKRALERGSRVEKQIEEKYGSMWKAGEADDVRPLPAGDRSTT